MSTATPTRPRFRRPEFFQQRVEQLFDELTSSASSQDRSAPNMEQSDTKEGYQLVVELSGCSSSNIRVSADERTLLIVGNKTSGINSDSQYRAEVPLPHSADQDNISAKYDNGVLTINIPWSSSGGRSKQIPIK